MVAPATGSTPEPALDALWERWCETRAIHHRDALAERYTPFVRMLAAQLYAQRFSGELEFADYLHFGLLAMLQALERFQPQRGVRFEAFVEPSVRGAILDGISRLSEVQRQVATRREILRERSLSLTEAKSTGKGALERLADVALGLAMGFALEDSGMYVSEQHPTMPCNAYQRIEFQQLCRNIAELVGTMPHPWGLVIHRHYLQQQAFTAIAEHLQLSKARVSQIHREGLQRLREEYRRRQTISNLA
jgi:RNA polymerase sigma factor for flagellar operon FliA